MRSLLREFQSQHADGAHAAGGSGRANEPPPLPHVYPRCSEIRQGSVDVRLESVRISGTARQREGRIDFLTVLDALRSQAAADADLASADRAVAFAQVDLFRALGGGWTES